MSAPPILPDNAPFSSAQRAWLNGYLAGLLVSVPGTVPSAPPPAPAGIPLLIAFGSQTGTAGGLARRISKEAVRRGFSPTVRELNAVTPAELAVTSLCVIATSTWGDGDPPDNAADFWARLTSDDAPRLDSLAFAVLALGDRNYPEFCGAGRKFDERLVGLGARRLLPRVDCDTDYDAAAGAWMDSLWPVLAEVASATPVPPPSPVPPTSTPSQAADPAPLLAAGTRRNPYPARLKASRRLSRPGSAKDIRHHEIDIAGSGIDYTVGDALGVLPRNAPGLVDGVLGALGLDADAPAGELDGAAAPVREWLSRALVLTAVPPALLREAATRAGNGDLLALLDPARKAELDAWLWGRDVPDLLSACPSARFEAAELPTLLRPLQPRLYSISSSPKAHPGEVHLTVGTVRYEAHGRPRSGVASGWLAEHVTVGTTEVPVFVQTSKGFRLPDDPATPIIMVGPGTGIAPFRAFLEERRAVGATGRNWLFFGDQQRALDFLYEDELTAWHADGHLTRLDLAFSRDQAAKVYVQERMRGQAVELFAWLEAGAHFYVCGDARRMARDVDEALHEIVATAGGLSAAAAAEYVAALRSTRRYQRDVY